MKKLSQKQRDRVAKKLNAKRVKLEGQNVRLDAALAALEKAKARVWKLQEAKRATEVEIEGLLDRQRWHDETCHACGCCLAWERGEIGRFVAYSPDGETEIGYRCGECQKVARAVSPPSVYGKRWRDYVAHDDLAPKGGAA